mmetsp:Transcript_21988/g.44479  ORF Transcript_21988/g.44479 Transcript_21988/m.44479 type:complete len:345 (-) Transcript_21988:141-1175(-)|eukprot:CAMPEP_0183315844 /NCGR_PEP_ID=MMETSP0160_2-20130417/53008_1 /TAXON_ID=2839 ORGANISM="Odontella Sinensis, Strain Grunow 1884" /NCGR_SAMPLE_ID=MMETSP0160_2 /ASSEMBLY_ACC=CAM_ASM_000250 /LENGTH=344 /DNA_ID=CAMNT_0025481511 /DNA_START=91 /DNA_END=1125 /DNA_ORIENTATION=-
MTSKMPMMKVPVLHTALSAAGVDKKKKDRETEPELYPNALWEHIETRSWNGVIDGLEADDAASMAARYYHENLPLHAACRHGAPEGVVIGLVDAYPEAAGERGKDRKLPLQVAIVKGASYRAVKRLICANPEALDARLDDRSLIDVRTTRSWLDVKAIPADVKQLLRKSAADWEVIATYEREQAEQATRIAELQGVVEENCERNERTEESNEELGRSLEEMRHKHRKYRASTDKKIRDLRDTLEASIKDLRETLAAFVESQAAKNKELQVDIESAAAREVVTKAAFKGYTEDLLSLYRKTTCTTEELSQRISVFERQGSIRGRKESDFEKQKAAEVTDESDHGE